MFDKFKMWLMTDENRQKHIMEKEKAEREAKRNNVDDKKSDSKKEKSPKDKPVKEKPTKEKKGGLFGKKKEEPEVIEEPIENTYEDTNDSDSETVTEEKPLPKKVVVVKKKDNLHSALYDELNNSNEKEEKEEEEDEININDESLGKLDAFISETTNTDLESTKETIEVKVEEVNPEVVSETVEKIEDNKGNESEYETKHDSSIFADSPEEYKKIQMLNKKKEEEDRYYDIVLGLPPTADMSYFVSRAFDAGVPEWYLRKTGYINESLNVNKVEDVTVATEKVENNIEKVAVEKLKEQLKIDGLDNADDEDLLEVIENVLEEDEEDVLEEINSETVEKVKNDIISESKTEEIIEIDLSDVVESIEPKDRELLSIVQDEENIKEEKSVIDKLLEEEKARIEESEKEKRDLEMRKKSSDLLKKLREKVINTPVKSDTVADTLVDSSNNVSDINIDKLPSSDESLVNSDDVKRTLSEEEKLKLKLKARNAIKEVVKESAETLMDKETENKAKLNVEERLKNLKKKREVLTAKGNNILVKEGIEVDGKVISTYKSYNVSDEEMSKIEVGKEVETDVELVETELLVDGEVYNLSEEEEAELIRKYSTREIWLLSDNEDLLDRALTVLNGTRYETKLVRTEKDFVMSIRSVDNLIVFTKDIPKTVQKSVAGFLKYLTSEKRKARLVTIEESKVNSKIIEHCFDELTIENLDNYYNEYDYTLYREIKKPISELYKEISFDLSNELNKDTIEVEVVGEEESNFEKVLTFSDDVLIDLGSKSNETLFGDIELELDDTIIIDSDDSN